LILKITKTHIGLARESLLNPFGFKGKYINELWHTAVKIEDDCGIYGTGIGVQSVLWSDPEIFNRFGPCGGNALMMTLTCKALEIAKDLDWNTPLDLLDAVLPRLAAAAKGICPENMRLTFLLNALVPLDNAAWIFYSRKKNIDSFDRLLPSSFRSALTEKQNALAVVPLLTYNVSREEIHKLARAGHSMFKIKIGSDPEKNGSCEAMLEWDKKRISEIHEILSDYTTPYTATGKIAWYLDANGRYDNKERLMKLLDHADRLGILSRILLLEEPFAEDNHVNVHDLPVRIAADESAHSDTDAARRVQEGYGAIAVKAVAKTLSMSLKVIRAVCEKNIPCFCADLTVPPVLLEWNRNLACRLAALPGMKCGILESNGAQNYGSWEAMLVRHPAAGAAWLTPAAGVFNLDEQYYKMSGGLFLDSSYYLQLACDGFICRSN